VFSLELLRIGAEAARRPHKPAGRWCKPIIRNHQFLAENKIKKGSTAFPQSKRKMGWDFSLGTNRVQGCTICPEVSVSTDEIDQSKQAREDALLALFQSNSFPGVEHIPLKGMAELRAMCESAATLGPDDILVFLIDREVLERGPQSAISSAWVLSNLPANVHGRVMLSFQGWAEDLRELFEIPEVVAFCRILLFGSISSPSLEHAQMILQILIDETTLGAQGEEAPGQYWLVSVAFHEQIMLRSQKSRTGIYRDVARNIEIRNWLLGKGPAPGTT